ncbi:pilus assembly protein PilP [Desulforhopalus singaporensis]|uniref:Type IV pilus assembly protein PilP n=1 Tax=Desulforhopalus singaporensis TaxID=91360 RepID=A0A1H0SFN8_9BACT|nr:pilus assembly protein PilP [Desulforhopalus singaporensis]SDP39976.1 type IV pilus assembly protein PilP [Desulforhopalus singaporensis]
MNTYKADIKGRIVTGCAVFLITLALQTGQLFCAVSGEEAGATQPTPAKIQPPAAQKELFKYALENRKDPFVPFITEKAASASKVNMNEIVDVEKPLTGMQLFEPGQLTLVALLSRGREDLAMVQDFTGKGYILKEGMKIGRRGVVKDIASNNVIIEETAVTRAGKKIITEVVMILKKEGEE